MVLPGVLGAPSPEACRGVGRLEAGRSLLEARGLLDEDGGAADGAGDAGALVERAGLEGLSVLVVFAVQVTAHRHHV